MSAKRKDSPVLRWGRAKVVELFGADLRSLAALRIALALLVLADLAGRAVDLSAHYSDQGVLPRSALLEDLLHPWAFSLNLMNGQPVFQALLFGITALAALALLVGYRTRLTTVLLWVLLLSIQRRNTLVFNTGDLLLHLLLFWGIFLPLGARWSVDRVLKTVRPRSSMSFLSMATVGLFLQIAFVYWFTAILKSGPDWRVDGTALYYTLSLDDIRTPLGAYLYQFPELLKVMTFATLGLEAFGPFLLFFPFFTGPVRTGAVLAFMGLHFGIWSTMPIGLFSWVAAFCMVCFLPAWFWDKAVPKLRAAFPAQPEIAQRLKRDGARVVETYLSPIWVRLSAAAGAKQPSAAKEVGDVSREGSRVARGEAVSDAETPQQGKTRRGAKGEREAKPNDTEEHRPTILRSSLTTNLLATFFVLYIFFTNLTTVSEFKMPERLDNLGTFLGLNQNWGVFAPNPLKTDGWYVIPGTLRDGRQIDLMPATVYRDFSLREGVSWEKPESVPDTLKNKYWRKYLGEIRLSDNEELRQPFARYICRQWNANHTGDEQLVELQFVFMRETTLPDYQPPTPERVILREHNCS